MTKIKFLLNSFFLSCLFFVASLLFTTSASASPRLYFNPANITPQSGADIQVDVLIDVESNASFGVDATISIPPEITVKSITNGQFFDTFFNAPVTNGQLELHGYLSAAFATKTGSGTFARLTLTSSKTLGASQIGFICNTGGTETEIINALGQNILGCSSLNSLTLTYSTETASPSPTPGNNNNTNNPTNSCGGTCGSNYNCSGGLFCFQGFCRNPFCQSDPSCGCKVTPKPSPTAKPKPKPLTSATPLIVKLTKFTPFPSSMPSPVPTETPKVGQSTNIKSVIIRAGMALLGIILLIIIIRTMKRKGNPPKITPPMGPGGGQTNPIQSYPVDPPFPPIS